MEWKSRRTVWKCNKKNLFLLYIYWSNAISHIYRPKRKTLAKKKQWKSTLSQIVIPFIPMVFPLHFQQFSPQIVIYPSNIPLPRSSYRVNGYPPWLSFQGSQLLCCALEDLDETVTSRVFSDTTCKDKGTPHKSSQWYDIVHFGHTSYCPSLIYPLSLP